MNTLPMREVSLVVMLTTMSSFADDPTAIIEVTEHLLTLVEDTQSLDSMQLFGIPVRDCIRLVSTGALLIYITERIIRLVTPAVKFIIGLFKRGNP